VLYGRYALRIGLLLCLLTAAWPALDAELSARAEQGGWAIEPATTVSVFDDLAARPCVTHAASRPAQRTTPPHSSRALAAAAAPAATPLPATHRTRAMRSHENRRDLHLRNGVLLI